MLTVPGCRTRQKRLIDALAKLNLDGAVITHRDHVHYFCNFRPHWNQVAAALIETTGRVTLIGHGFKKEEIAADELAEFAARFGATMTSDQAARAAEVVKKLMPAGKKFGADLEGPAALVRAAGHTKDITGEILRLRKRKDPDEIACLKHAISACEAMYDYVKRVIKPGLNELELFGQLKAIAATSAGQDPERFGNDFCCGQGGGLPRSRPMQAGELYVLDLGPSYDGYHADNCRTFAADRKGTDVQHKACAKIIASLAYLEKQIKPGLSAKALFQMAKEFLADAGHSGLCHHLGHGVGLQPHESPQLNPDYDAVFEIGDTFTMEPGLYSKELNAGIRLEQQYLLTEKGVERLTSFPLELV